MQTRTYQNLKIQNFRIFGILDRRNIQIRNPLLELYLNMAFGDDFCTLPFPLSPQRPLFPLRLPLGRFLYLTIPAISQMALFPLLMPSGLCCALYHFSYLPKGTFPFVNAFRAVFCTLPFPLSPQRHLSLY